MGCWRRTRGTDHDVWWMERWSRFHAHRLGNPLRPIGSQDGIRPGRSIQTESTKKPREMDIWRRGWREGGETGTGPSSAHAVEMDTVERDAKIGTCADEESDRWDCEILCGYGGFVGISIGGCPRWPRPTHPHPSVRTLGERKGKNHARRGFSTSPSGSPLGWFRDRFGTRLFAFGSWMARVMQRRATGLDGRTSSLLSHQPERCVPPR